MWARVLLTHDYLPGVFPAVPWGTLHSHVGCMLCWVFLGRVAIYVYVNSPSPHRQCQDMRTGVSLAAHLFVSQMPGAH